MVTKSKRKVPARKGKKVADAQKHDTGKKRFREKVQTDRRKQVRRTAVWCIEH